MMRKSDDDADSCHKMRALSDATPDDADTSMSADKILRRLGCER